MGLLTKLVGEKYANAADEAKDKATAYQYILHSNDPDLDPSIKRYALTQLLHLSGAGQGKQGGLVQDLFSKMLGIHHSQQRQPMDEKPPAGVDTNAYGDSQQPAGNVSAGGGLGEGDAPDQAPPAQSLPPMPQRNGQPQSAAPGQPATPAPAMQPGTPQAQPQAMAQSQGQPETGAPIQPGAPPQWPQRPQRQQRQLYDAKGNPVPNFFLSPQEVGERDLARNKPYLDYQATQAQKLENLRTINKREEEKIHYDYQMAVELAREKAKIVAAQAHLKNLPAALQKSWEAAAAKVHAAGGDPNDHDQVQKQYEADLIEDAALERDRKIERNKSTNMRIEVMGEGMRVKQEERRSVPDYLQAMREGRLDPNLSGVPRELKAQVYDAAVKDPTLNMARLNLEYGAVKRSLATMNGAQQTRMRVALDTLSNTLPSVKQAYQDWKKTGLPGNYKLFNKAALLKAKNSGNPQQSAAAQTLDTLIQDMVAETSAVYMSGNSPTDSAMKRASENLKSEWNEAVFNRELEVLTRNLQTRQNVIETLKPAGVDQNSVYMPQSDVDPGGILTEDEKKKFGKPK